MVSQIVFLVLRIFELLLLGRVLLSWFPNIDRSNPIVQFLYDVTEPVLRPVRNWLGGMGMSGMMDFSPIFVFLIIQVLRIILPNFLRF
jgi:YggT family protein